MSDFSPEIFDLGMLQSSHTKARAERKSIVYRIFHIGDSTPTSDDDRYTIGHSKKSSFSGSESEMSDDESGSSYSNGSTGRNSTRIRWKSNKSTHKPSIFNTLDSDHSEDEELKPKSKSTHSLLKDFLHFKDSLSKKKDSNLHPTPPQSTPLPPTTHSDEPDKFNQLLLPSSSKRRSSTCSDKSEDGSFWRKSLSRTPSETSLQEKYGSTECVLGRGTFATVKLCCPVGSKLKYAVKEFRKKKKDESSKEYIKKLQAEFCIASTLDNENVVKSVDLIQDAKHAWCVVMEYCQGGDLFTRINNGSLSSETERNCYLSQLVHGVAYLHSIGVSHRDLKPENILLDGTNRILKITDFGVSTVFKSPFGAKREKQRGLTGSGPYIAPEEYSGTEYDSELVDIWAIGIIAYVMVSNSIPWRAATVDDSRFRLYMESQRKFAPFERGVQPGLRNLLYKILEADPLERISIAGILEDGWIQSIEYCTVANYNVVNHVHTSHG